MVELIINIAMVIIYLMIVVPVGMFLSKCLGSGFNDYIYLIMVFVIYFFIALVVSFIINSWVAKQINAATKRFKEDKDIDKYLAELDRCEKLVRKRNRPTRSIIACNSAYAYSEIGDVKAAKTMMLNLDVKVPKAYEYVYNLNMAAYSFLLDENVEAIEYYMTIDPKQLERVRARAKFNVDMRCCLAFVEINKYIYEGSFAEARALLDDNRQDMLETKPGRVGWLEEKINRYEAARHEIKR